MSTKVKNEIIEVGTWLPVFTGFYNTCFEPDEENEIEYINEMRRNGGLNEITYDEIDWDYQSQFEDIALDCCMFIEDEMIEFVEHVKIVELK